MKVEVGNKNALGAGTVGSVLRGAGRVALWALVGLLLVRGVLATTAAPPAEAPAPSPEGGTRQAEEALAIRFARAYLADPASPGRAGLLAEGAELAPGRGPESPDPVVGAEVAASEDLGGGRAILTVACELGDSRALYLAVPIARSEAGEVAASGAPWLVAAPGRATVPGDRPRPLLGPEAGQIAELARRFLAAYVEASSPSDLSYFLAPGAIAPPLGAGLRLVEVAGVAQLGAEEGPRRTVAVRARLEDPASGAIYPLAYRLELQRGERWYVAGVLGALA